MRTDATEKVRMRSPVRECVHRTTLEQKVYEQREGKENSARVHIGTCF